MLISETFITALQALRSNKVRTFLTMLGVIIGVFAVLSLVSLVQGVKNFVTDQFSALGSNLIMVAGGKISAGSDPSSAFSNSKLSIDDVSNIQKFLSQEIVGASPSIRIAKSATYKNKSFLASLVGTSYQFPEITNFKVAKGRSFTKPEQDASARVAVIGHQVAEELFGSVDPLNKVIKVSGVNFTVIGVLETKGYNSDERVFMPYTTVQNSLDVSKLSGIMIKAKNSDSIDATIGQVELVLLRNHKKDDFTVLSQKDILNSVQSILNVLTIGLSAIAGISLLVGGIGIMNIMLVSVNERISEIGLRKAVGATPANIALQFLLESTMLSVIGGVIGILLGIAATLAVKSYLNAQVPLWAVLVSFGFSLAVGTIFGTYPAISASRKDPIEALRYEL